MLLQQPGSCTVPQMRVIGKASLYQLQRTGALEARRPATVGMAVNRNLSSEHPVVNQDRDGHAQGMEDRTQSFGVHLYPCRMRLQTASDSEAVECLGQLGWVIIGVAKQTPLKRKGGYLG